MTIHALPTVQRLKALRAHCLIDDQIRSDMDMMEGLASGVFDIFAMRAKTDLGFIVDMMDTSFCAVPREPAGIENRDNQFRYAMVWTPQSRAIEFMGGPKDGDKPLVLPEGQLWRPLHYPVMNRPYESFTAADDEIPQSGIDRVTYDYYGFNDISRNWVYRVTR